MVTWLGVSYGEDGSGSRFAALTNVRAPHLMKENAPTRGLLVSNYLASNLTPEEYIREIRHESYHYNGFNLLVGDGDTMIWYSNFGMMNPKKRDAAQARHFTVCPMPCSTIPGRRSSARAPQFASLLGINAPEEAYFEMLSDTTKAPDRLLPHTGVSHEWEKLLSAVCIESDTYGTRASTLVELYNDEPPVLHERVIR